MGAKMDESKSEVVRIRIMLDLRERCSKARNSGSWSGRTESDFLGYLIELGIVRYERSVLPIERGDDLVTSGISTGAPTVGTPKLGSGQKNAG